LGISPRGVCLLIMNGHIDFKHMTSLPLNTHLRDPDTGSDNANGDYSVSPKQFIYVPKQKGDPDGHEIVEITGVSMQLSDRNIAPDKYAGLMGGLTNGIVIGVKSVLGSGPDLSDTELFRITDESEAIKTNRALNVYFFDGGDSILDYGPGIEDLQPKNNLFLRGQQFILDGRQKHYIFVLLQDNFTGVDKHEFHIFGRIINKSYCEYPFSG